jgi:hypothetical protein
MDYQVSVMGRHCHGHITHAWGETTSKSDTDMNQGPTKATKYAVKQSAVQLSWKPLCGKCQVFTGQLWFFQGTTIWSVHGYMNFQCMVTWQLVCATICKLHILTMVFALIWGSEKKGHRFSDPRVSGRMFYIREYAPHLYMYTQLYNGVCIDMGSVSHLIFCFSL